MRVKFPNERFLLAATIVLAGCSQQPSRLVAPAVSSRAGADAIEKFDTDKSGSLESKELAASPALKAALARLDKDSDGKITAADIDARVEACANPGSL